MADDPNQVEGKILVGKSGAGAAGVYRYLNLPQRLGSGRYFFLLLLRN